MTAATPVCHARAVVTTFTLSVTACLRPSVRAVRERSSGGRQVSQPEKTIPVALFSAVGVMLLSYLVPLTVAAAADPDWHCWQDGSFGVVARRIGGAWLGYLCATCSSHLPSCAHQERRLTISGCPQGARIFLFGQLGAILVRTVGGHVPAPWHG